MNPRRSLTEVVTELQQLMYQKYHDANISSWIECDPEAVVRGTRIRVRARIFAEANVLADLEPVVGSEDIPGFRRRRLKQCKVGTGFREYATRLASGDLEAGNTYHLTLHPRPDADAIARCAVHVFKKGVAAAVRRQIAEIISGPRKRRSKRHSRRRR